MRFRGVWNSGVTYEMGDCVTRQGGIWVCRAHSTVKAPGSAAEDWHSP